MIPRDLEATSFTKPVYKKPPSKKSRILFQLLVLTIGCLCITVLFVTRQSIKNFINAFMPTYTENNYKVVEQHTSADQTLFWAIIQYTGSNDTYIKPRNPYVKFLNLSLTFQSTNKFNLKITDSNNTRWEIPHQAPFSRDPDNTVNIPLDNGAVKLTMNTQPFSFSLTRKDTNEVIFDTSVHGFIFSDLYIEISTSLPRNDIYGFGERAYNLQLPTGGYTLWPKDQPYMLGDSKTDSQSLRLPPCLPPS